MLDAPLVRIVGDKTARALARSLDLHTVGDLLRHYPRRYERRAELTDLASIRVGEQVTVLAEVQKVTGRRLPERRHLVQAEVGDGRRTLTVAYFNQPYRERQLTVGRRGLFAGKVTRFNRTYQLTHPDYLLLDAAPDPADHPSDDPADSDAVDDRAGSAGPAIEEFAGGLIPVYPAAAGCPSWVVARCVRVALDHLDLPVDPLPEELRRRHGLVDLGTALRHIHRPPSTEARDEARRRLKWDEALALQLTLAQRRRSAIARPAVPRPPAPEGLLVAFDRALPFELTAGQLEVGRVLAAELAATHPMHRLLHGEVGSGKTVCALRAMLQVVDAGGQAALLAPTEVLAAQHLRSLLALLGPLGRAGQLGAAEPATRVTLLTGSQPASVRRQAVAEAASGQAGIVVGTHALLQQDVGFADLGLVVVDEQHRFGVEQRDALRAKGGAAPPHVLVMTATPIPRTVAMTVYGDLDSCALSELPAGRSTVDTHVVPGGHQRWIDRTWQRVREEVAAGRQAYVVCPRIGGAASDEDATAAADGEDGAVEEAARRPPLAVGDVAPMLAAGPLAGLSVGVLHGRLRGEDKDAVMQRFAAGALDVLVATTVVEVGLDVPNATVMVVLDADRFGVSQLHQLRGRVGRGAAPGLCLLVTDAELASPAGRRLAAVASTLDGFELARLDLEQRREGDVLGAAQSGRRSHLRLLSLLADGDLITQAREEAAALVADDPDLSAHPALAAAVRDLVDEQRADYLEKA